MSERELQPQTWNFYPRSPCGERPCDNSTGFAYIEISIHALLAESDTIAGSDCSTFGISIHALLAESDPPNSLAFFLASSFLSTLSLRRATRHGRLGSAALHISIHALLAESDSFLQRDIHPWLRFLSTLSLRRATPIGYVTSHWFQFLSTLSLRRATAFSGHPVAGDCYFYPRSPCGERRGGAAADQQQYHISIHALLAESDL